MKIKRFVFSGELVRTMLRTGARVSEAKVLSGFPERAEIIGVTLEHADELRPPDIILWVFDESYPDSASVNEAPRGAIEFERVSAPLVDDPKKIAAEWFASVEYKEQDEALDSLVELLTNALIRQNLRWLMPMPCGHAKCFERFDREGKALCVVCEVNKLRKEAERWKETVDTCMLEALTERKHFIELRENLDKNYIHKDNAAHWAKTRGEAMKEMKK